MKPMTRSTVIDADFPGSGSAAERLAFALNYAILAPSSHNTQPWRFLVQQDSVLLCADRTRALPVVDPHDRELIISCAAALFNLRVALAHFGQPYRISLLPYAADTDVLAQVWIDGNGFLDRPVAGLFPSLATRVTNRHDFSPDPVPAALMAAIRDAAAAEGTGITLLEDEGRRLEAAVLIAEADRIQFSDPRFRRELAMWIHGSRRGDGMPAFSGGVPQLLDLAAPMVSAMIRTFDAGAGVAASHRRLVQGSPLLVLLSTSMDSPEAWLCAGQALERILLLADRAGCCASYLNQPVEVAPLRQQLAELAGADRFPQLLLRLGKGRPDSPSPRRPLREVLQQ